jgi:GTP-binding protein HflX
LLLTDTVGFIQKLSPAVVAAFRATLEELAESDLLLHVVDINHPKAPEQVHVVETTLNDLGLAAKPRLLVINKLDLLSGERDGSVPVVLPDQESYPTVFISAARGWNLDQLLRETEGCLMSIDGPLTVARP